MAATPVTLTAPLALFGTTAGARRTRTMAPAGAVVDVTVGGGHRGGMWAVTWRGRDYTAVPREVMRASRTGA